MTKNIYIYNPDFKRDLRYDYDCSHNTSISQISEKWMQSHHQTFLMDSLGAKLLHYLFLSEFITGVVGFALLWIVKEIKWALQ